MSRSRRTRALAVTVGLAGLITVAACSGSGSTAGPSSAAAPTSAPATQASETSRSANATVASRGPCGAATAAPKIWKHVVWVWMENHSTQQVIGRPGSAAAKRAPYVNGTLAKYCGLATGYHAVTHPSLPNYIAATSGSTHGITSDCLPSKCPVPGSSLFSQVASKGGSWRTYAESMRTGCSRTNSGRYAPKHNPAVYYDALGGTCSARDVPFGATTTGNFVNDVRANRLSAFTFVEPNLCSDTHDCSVRTGDNWLATVLPTVFASGDYRAGRTAVFLVWDEGEGGSRGQPCTTSSDPSCRIPLLVMSRSVPTGKRVATTASHYSLLRTTEAMLGLTTYLGRARTAPDLRASLGLR